MDAGSVENVTAMQGFHLSACPEYLEANRAADFFFLTLDLFLFTFREAILSTVLPFRFLVATMHHAHRAFIAIGSFFKLEGRDGVNDILDLILVRNRIAVRVQIFIAVELVLVAFLVEILWEFPKELILPSVNIICVSIFIDSHVYAATGWSLDIECVPI